MKCELSEDAIKSYLESWKVDDLSQKISALRKLSAFSELLEPTSIQRDIMPPLKGSEPVHPLDSPIAILAKEEDDEVLFVIAEQLGNFTFLSGADSLSGAVLAVLLTIISFLEYLARSEDMQVRSRVAQSLNQLVDSIKSDVLVEEHFSKLYLRLATSDRFGPRALSCELLTHIYSRLKDAFKIESRKLFRNLFEDKEPVVRKAAFVNLKNLVVLMGPECIKKDYLDFLRLFDREEIDSIRLHAVHNAITIGKQLGGDLGKIRAFFFSLFSDRFWRVRFTGAKNFGAITLLLKDCEGSGEVVSHYVKLLMDQEVEVRVAAADSIANVCTSVSPEFIENPLMPTLDILVCDESHFVRAAMASVIANIPSAVLNQRTTEQLFDLISKLLRDDNSNVRLTMAQNLEKVLHIFSDDSLLKKLAHLVRDLCDDRQWRIRMEVVNTFPQFSQHLKLEEFGALFWPQVVDYLQDCVFAIRKAAIKTLHKITIMYGDEWFVKFVLPKVVGLSESTNYLFRVAAISMLTKICPVVNDNVRLDCLNLLIYLSNDLVPNVRLNVCKALNEYTTAVNQANFEIIKVVLSKLEVDVDPDVVYYTSLVTNQKTLTGFLG